MKSVICLATAILLTACGSTKTANVDTYSQRAEAQRAQQAQEVQQAIAKAPKWMSELPVSVDAVYAKGTATSTDMQMAELMAKTFAYKSICMSADGKVSSQNKQFGTESGVTAEVAIRTVCANVSITGVESKITEFVNEGNKIRAYVLIALPIGDANTMRKAADAQEDRATLKERREKAFKDLDERSEVRTVPQSKVTLVDVDNEEYKARRDATLQKPGAVLGHVTLR